MSVSRETSTDDTPWRCGHVDPVPGLRPYIRVNYDCRACSRAATLSAITVDQRAAITWAEGRHHGITATLWRDNVIHGEQLLRDSGTGFPMMVDCGETLLRLAAVGVVQHTVFRPSHSGAAFLGLEFGAHKQSRTAPHAGDAAHWCWVVVGDFEILGVV